MTTTDKLRGLLLAALLTMSTVAGVVALSGSVAASGNNVGIISAVEAEGTVEVIFNTSTFSDPPESTDVDVWIDGTRVIDDGASDTNLGGQTWTVGDFALSGSNATFKIETDGTPQNIDPNRNLTVEFEGATNTDPETEVTVTQAVVTEGGSADTVDNAQRIYQGDDIAIEATSTDADVFLNTTSQDISTGTDSRYLTVSTESFSTGTTTEVQFDRDLTNVQYFDVQDLGLTATATDTSITDVMALTVDVSSNRGGVPFTATLLDGDDTEEETVTSDFAGDGTATLDFGTQSAADGPYTVRVVDNQTNASATTSDITVTESRPAGIDSAVEAGGDVEVVFNTSAFDDPPESGDVNMWVDGTRIVDGGASDTNLDGQSWTISGFTQSGRSASFTVQTDGSTQDVAASRNLTVEFEDVTRSGGNPDPETAVTTTAAVVTEGGSADTEGSALRIYAGSDIAVETMSTDADVFVTATGQALRTGPDSDLLVIDSGTLPAGVTELQFDGDETNDQFVDVTDLGLTATATDTAIDEGTALRVNVSALRGGEPFTATLRGDSGTPVETTTGTLSATDNVTADFGTRSPGEYTVRVVDNATNVSATTSTIAVSSSGSGGGGGGESSTDDDVVHDPEEIGTLVDIPDDVRPVAGEEASVLLTSAGGEATFTGPPSRTSASTSTSPASSPSHRSTGSNSAPPPSPAGR